MGKKGDFFIRTIHERSHQGRPSSGLEEGSLLGKASGKSILQRLEISTDELAKINGALHAHMTGDEVQTDMGSVLEYEDRTDIMVEYHRRLQLEASNANQPSSEEERRQVLKYLRVEVERRELTSYQRRVTSTRDQQNSRSRVAFEHLEIPLDTDSRLSQWPFGRNYQSYLK
ncbi:hypothetical protein HPB51_011582 [Rhipicephalus microplus]|uniref:Uncharacterized protein n=1 Tax=Rhipicephalus microplus TaxID=6941 RepID=A0A9J6F3A6_RHIMP|nr:hypothetical protein HPB51_011582 [Rhipicephalus microplus]